MQAIIQNIIPDTIDELFDKWDQDDSERYRLTLLHKTDDSLYCFLSGNMQEVKPDQKIDMGMTIAFSRKKTKIQTHYDVVFQKKDVDDGYYFLFGEDSPLEEKTKVIPFKYDTELPSVIIQRNLKQRLLDYISSESDSRIESMEYYGEHNLISSLLHFRFNKEYREKKKSHRQTLKSLRKDITDLFKDEQSPSTFIQPIQYKEEDRNKKAMFTKKSELGKILLTLPIAAFIPYSLIQSKFEIENKV